MAKVAVGDVLPQGELLTLSPPVDGVCVNAAETLKTQDNTKPTLFVVVPGAFTPTCSEHHIPAFLTKKGIKSLKESGIKSIIILSVDSPFITRAWGQSLVESSDAGREALNEGFIKFASDAGGKWLKSLGLANEAANDAFAKDGIRGIRSAVVVGEDNTIEYIGSDTKRGTVEFSGIDGVLNGWKFQPKL